MTSPTDHAEAVASAAFDRYAKAATRFQRTQRPAHALIARRAFDRFLSAFLSPEELDGIRQADIPALRRDA